MNPPYDGDLHLDFFNRALDNLAEDGKVCIVEPGQWLVQLKNNGKYTKEKSKADEIKKKTAGHVKDVELQNLNKEFNIANKTVCSIVTVDYSKDYNKIRCCCIKYFCSFSKCRSKIMRHHCSQIANHIISIS